MSRWLPLLPVKETHSTINHARALPIRLNLCVRRTECRCAPKRRRGAKRWRSTESRGRTKRGCSTTCSRANASQNEKRAMQARNGKWEHTKGSCRCCCKGWRASGTKGRCWRGCRSGGCAKGRCGWTGCACDGRAEGQIKPGAWGARRLVRCTPNAGAVEQNVEAPPPNGEGAPNAGAAALLPPAKRTRRVRSRVMRALSALLRGHVVSSRRRVWWGDAPKAAGAGAVPKAGGGAADVAVNAGVAVPAAHTQGRESVPDRYRRGDRISAHRKHPLVAHRKKLLVPSRRQGPEKMQQRALPRKPRAKRLARHQTELAQRRQSLTLVRLPGNVVLGGEQRASSQVGRAARSVGCVAHGALTERCGRRRRRAAYGSARRCKRVLR